MDTSPANNQGLRDALRASADPRVLRTRTQIFDAVHRLSEEGSALSVAAIAREAGVSRATFYSHYEGLDDLASSLRGEAFTVIGALYLADRRMTADALRISQERLVAHFIDNRALYLAVTTLPVSKEIHLESVREMAEIIERTLAQHPSVPAGLRIDAVARYIASAAIGLLDAWLTGEIDLTEEELVEHLTRQLPPWFNDAR